MRHELSGFLEGDPDNAPDDCRRSRWHKRLIANDRRTPLFPGLVKATVV
jgi:hypothetical protein